MVGRYTALAPTSSIAKSGFNPAGAARATAMLTATALAPVIMQGISSMFNRGQSTQKSTSTAVNEGRNFNVTSTSYKRKKRKKRTRRSRKRAQQAKKFKRRVISIVQGPKGLKSITRNTVAGNLVTAADQASYQFLTMYGNSNADVTTPGSNDLRAILGQDGLDIDTTTLMIHGFYGLITIKNEHTQSVYVDIYEITNKKPYNTNTVSMIGEFNRGLTDVGTQATAVAWNTTTNGISDWQISPFVNTPFLKNWSVLNKRTVLMSAQDTIQWEWKRGKMWKYDASKLEQYDLLYPSCQYMIVVRGSPSGSSYAAAVPASTVRTYFTRTISYTRETAGVNSEMDPAAGRLA